MQEYIAERVDSEDYNGFWIGANDRKTEGTFQWVSGNDFNYLYCLIGSQ